MVSSLVYACKRGRMKKTCRCCAFDSKHFWSFLLSSRVCFLLGFCYPFFLLVAYSPASRDWWRVAFRIFISLWLTAVVCLLLETKLRGAFHVASFIGNVWSGCIGLTNTLWSGHGERARHFWCSVSRWGPPMWLCLIFFILFSLVGKRVCVPVCVVSYKIWVPEVFGLSLHPCWIEKPLFHKVWIFEFQKLIVVDWADCPTRVMDFYISSKDSQANQSLIISLINSRFYEGELILLDLF